MTLDEAIKHEDELAEYQKELYRLCPASESEIFHCDGTKDCKTLKNGENKGCQKCAEEHKHLAEWLKELKQLREQIESEKKQDEDKIIVVKDVLKQIKDEIENELIIYKAEAYIKVNDVYDLFDKYTK